MCPGAGGRGDPPRSTRIKKGNSEEKRNEFVSHARGKEGDYVSHSKSKAVLQDARVGRGKGLK